VSVLDQLTAGFSGALQTELLEAPLEAAFKTAFADELSAPLRVGTPKATDTTIALFPPLATADQLAVPGGEPYEALNVPVVDLGPAAGRSDRRAIEHLAERFAGGTSPIRATISGSAVVPIGRRMALVALVNSEAICELQRNLTAALRRTGMVVPVTSAYLPHIVLHWLGPREAPVLPDLPRTPLTFSELGLCWGPERLSYTFRG